MMLKAVLVFLVAMAMLGLLGKGRRRMPRAGRDAKIEAARKCPSCGAYIIGEAPCICGASSDRSST
jgi:ribosomal protein L32